MLFFMTLLLEKIPASIVKVNATLQDFEGDIGRGVAFSLTKRCV